MPFRRKNTLLLVLLLPFCATINAWVEPLSRSTIVTSQSHQRISSRTLPSYTLSIPKQRTILPSSFVLKASSSDIVIETIEGSAFLDPIHNNDTKTAIETSIHGNEFANATTIENDSQALVIESSSETQNDDILSSELVEEHASQNEVYTYEQKFTNLVVLSLAFGYAFYTILSIDGGMTRGWSASEIAMRIPLDNWGAYESYLANKPILTKSLINVIIYLLGDWLSQTAFTKTNNLLEFDLQRTLRNGLIGLCFGPLVHEYYEFSDAILPPQNGLVTRLQKILMDQTLYLTIKCSMYIGAVGLLAGEDRKTIGQTIRDKIGGIVVTAWKFWPIVHCVTYSVIPSQHRVLWVNSVDLVWNAILSSAAQKSEPEESSAETNELVSTASSAMILEEGETGQSNTTNTGVAWVAT